MPLIDPVGHELSRKHFVLVRKLGDGNFGTVELHKLWGRDVAVKTMKYGAMAVEAFIREAKIMQKLHHPNVLRYLGIVTMGSSWSPSFETKMPVLLVTEFMKNGSLCKYLRNHHVSIHPETMFSVAIDVSFTWISLNFL